jgi:uncharacterized membrane protein YhiD involved in acid resistance
MFQGFNSIISTSLTVELFIGNLLIALLCGFLVSFFYRKSYRGPNYSPSFVQAIIILSMVTALVIMVIGNNLARAFGLVGAMSIIRFRTAIKDTQDIVFIFFSLATGMAAGVGLRFLAILGTILIGIILLLLKNLNYAKLYKKEFLIQFLCRMTEMENPYIPVFKKYCKQYKLVNMQSAGEENLYELSFYLELKDQNKHPLVLKELNQLPQIESVRLFFDEEQN